MSNGQAQEDRCKNTKIKKPQKKTSCKHSRSTDNCLDTQEGGLQKTHREHKQLHKYKHENDTHDTYKLQTAAYAKEPNSQILPGRKGRGGRNKPKKDTLAMDRLRRTDA